MKTLLILLALLSFGLASCAHAPKGTEEGPIVRDPAILFARTCGEFGPGQKSNGIKGGVWLKAKSKEASGQFPAQVLAPSPDELDLEVTNLLGAPQASIRVRGEAYELKVENRTEQGRYAWGGIPLKWATALFSGRIPCPPLNRRSDMKTSVDAAGNLVLELSGGLEHEPEMFTFHFRERAGAPWPESLVWEKRGTVPFRVDFTFEEPEEPGLSPRKWEARSALGEVKARWKEREFISPR